ncbi:hypothetical protein ACTFIR_007635 [Dictyostelium discoideum]
MVKNYLIKNCKSQQQEQQQILGTRISPTSDLACSINICSELGQPCNNSTPFSGFQCYANDRCKDGFCVPSLKQGCICQDSSDCEIGLSCVTFNSTLSFRLPNQTKTCQPSFFAEFGEDCVRATDCLNTLDCVNGKCSTPLYGCISDLSCSLDSYCFNGTCYKYELKENECFVFRAFSCKNTKNPCALKSFNISSIGECRPIIKEGDPCLTTLFTCDWNSHYVEEGSIIGKCTSYPINIPRACISQNDCNEYEFCKCDSQSGVGYCTTRSKFVGVFCQQSGDVFNDCLFRNHINCTDIYSVNPSSCIAKSKCNEEAKCVNFFCSSPLIPSSFCKPKECNLSIFNLTDAKVLVYYSFSTSPSLTISSFYNINFIIAIFKDKLKTGLIGSRIPITSDLACSINTCSELGQLCNNSAPFTGQRCYVNDRCKDGICVPSLKVGEICQDSGDCEIGSSCVTFNSTLSFTLQSQNKTCQPAFFAEFGEDCVRATDCLNSLDCINRKCSTPFYGCISDLSCGLDSYCFKAKCIKYELKDNECFLFRSYSCREARNPCGLKSFNISSIGECKSIINEGDPCLTNLDSCDWTSPQYCKPLFEGSVLGKCTPLPISYPRACISKKDCFEYEFCKCDPQSGVGYCTTRGRFKGAFCQQSAIVFFSCLDRNKVNCSDIYSINPSSCIAKSKCNEESKCVNFFCSSPLIPSSFCKTKQCNLSIFNFTGAILLLSSSSSSPSLPFLLIIKIEPFYNINFLILMIVTISLLI